MTAPMRPNPVHYILQAGGTAMAQWPSSSSPRGLEGLVGGEGFAVDRGRKHEALCDLPHERERRRPHSRQPVAAHLRGTNPVSSLVLIAASHAETR